MLRALRHRKETRQLQLQATIKRFLFDLHLDLEGPDSPHQINIPEQPDSPHEINPPEQPDSSNKSINQINEWVQVLLTFMILKYMYVWYSLYQVT